MSEKTHQPTEKKLRDAREKGQLARSKLFGASVVTLSGLSLTFAFMRETAGRLTSLTRSLLSGEATSPTLAMQQALEVLALGVAPTLLAAFIGALLVGVTQSGLQLNVGAIAPKLEHLNPAEGLKKLFSVRQLVDVVRGLAVAAFIGLLFWNTISELGPTAFNAIHHDGARGLVALLSLLQPLVIKAAVVLVVLGVGDWMLAKRRHVKDLMMSHQEVKQEHKNSEVDPHHKSMRKSLHKQLANGGRARGVQKATAVVVNPTHIAVALRYAEDECDAPYIVAKAREEDALKLRQEAAALGIPVVRDIPLARSLIHYDVGEEVPEELYQAAAAILKVALEEAETNKEGVK